MSAKRGRFISVEGIEGAGKSTCMRVLAALAAERGIELLQTREPGGTALGEELRTLLLGHRHSGMGDDTELLLMFAARAEHLHQIILPALKRGHWVLCDRFTDATSAYQGFGRGIQRERIRVLENWVQGELRPDLTILLDLPVDLGLERAGKRSEPDRFEREAQAFFERVRQGYLEMAHTEPGRYRVVDAARALEQVSNDIRQQMRDFIESIDA